MPGKPTPAEPIPAEPTSMPVSTKPAIAVARVNPFKVAINLTLLLLWCLLFPPVFLLGRALSKQAGDKLALIFHRAVARLFNLRIQVQGSPAGGPRSNSATVAGEQNALAPTLYVANHASYMDVFVLGSLACATFIAKSEVAGWPVLGKLAGFHNTLFVERNPRRAKQQIQQMRDFLTAGKSLFLFPEGTSTPGTHVDAFRSSLFAAADTPGARIQPVTIAFSHYDGTPMDQPTRDFYAWYLPMTFLPHFTNGLGLKPCQVQVTFHQAVSLADFPSRKDCAAHCEAQVWLGLATALAASPDFPPTTQPNYRPEIQP